VTRSELPTGTLTFVFTDIEGSTRLVKDLGDRYSAVLHEHHRLLREAFARNDGIEVSTEGDAFFVVFPSASAAVNAAVTAQRALADANWQEGIEIRVRMGLHTGEGQLVGDNYGGIDVHRAARISRAGHGGQVVLSDAARALVEASLPLGVRIKDLGEHALKDLDRPEHLYQLCIEGLRSEFPPLRSLEARPNNLPVHLTAFVARDKEVSDIKALLSHNRLVTLTGPGGTGKTRLGLEVGSQLLPGFRDGVFAVFLAPVIDPGLVASTVAEALSVREQGTIPISDSLKEFLEDKRTLLILDNFEHLVGATSFVAAILGAAPEVKALVTSRAALRISGEQEYPVPPMTSPDPKMLPNLELLSRYEAVELFLQRARAVKPDFALSEASARSVAEICWRLDGLPLAIELAAARIRLLQPDDILKRLRRGLSLLAGGARDVPARQRTLRAAIAWSYDLLEDPVRALFRRLGVFVGGWTFEATEEVCNPAQELGIDTLDALESLVDNSLVRRVETDEGATRFRMLQTIREFSLEELTNEGEHIEISRRHAAFFRSFVAERAATITTSSDAASLMEIEHDNIRAVLGWAVENAEAELAMEVASALWRFWMLRSHLAEGRQWLTEILALPEASRVTGLRGKTLMALGSVTYWQNDFDATRRYYEEGLAVFRELGDRAGIAEALYNSAFVHLIEHHPAEARARYEEARRLTQELGDERGLANTAWGLAMTALQERNWDEASRLAQETRDRYEALGDWFGMSLARFVFYQVARFTGDYEEARHQLMEYLDEAMERDDVVSVFSILENLPPIEVLQGHHERALKLGGAAEAFREQYGGGSPPPLIELEDPRESLRGILSDDRIAQLWNEGRAMSLHDAIAYARKDPMSG
jgi:predicted ATPase/class 3 adenylate cyclase